MQRKPWHNSSAELKLPFIYTSTRSVSLKLSMTRLKTGCKLKKMGQLFQLKLLCSRSFDIFLLEFQVREKRILCYNFISPFNMVSENWEAYKLPVCLPVFLTLRNQFSGPQNFKIARENRALWTVYQVAIWWENETLVINFHTP